MSYFLLSSAHEYILANLPMYAPLEIVSVYKQREKLTIFFDTDQERMSVMVPVSDFYHKYFQRRRYSIDFIYSVRDRSFAARVLLSKHYIESLDLKPSVISSYVQCLCVSQLNPKVEDYYSLNKYFHTFKWKSVLEQKLLLSCKVNTSLYDDFNKLSNACDVVDTNSKAFKSDILRIIQDFADKELLECVAKYSTLTKRHSDLQQLELITLLGLHLWANVGYQFNADYQKLLNILVYNQDITYPYGVLGMDSQRAIESTLDVIFQDQKNRKAV